MVIAINKKDILNHAKTYVLDSNNTFETLEKASEDKANKLYIFRKLEKREKPLLATLKAQIRLNREKISNVELTDEAYKDKKYNDWVEEYTLAEMKFVLAKDHYNNLIALKDMRITEETSARKLLNDPKI